MKTASFALLGLLSLSIATGAASCGGKGSKGDPGPTGPTGSPGPTGPSQVPPEIESIYPPFGSARTTFVLTGENYSTDIANDRVFFDGFEAVVDSSDGGTMQVSNAFLPLADARAMSVAVEVSNATSNAVTLAAFPNGASTSLFGSNLPIWSAPLHTARKAGALLIVDPSGLYQHDAVTGATTVLARNGAGGIGEVRNVFVDAAGRSVIHDRTPLGAGHLERMLVMTNGGFAEIHAEAISGGDEIVAGSFDSLKRLWLARASGVLQRIETDGTQVLAIGTLPQPVLAAQALGTDFFVLTSDGVVTKIDTSGAETTFSAADAGFPNPRLLGSDGATLFEINDTGLCSFNGAGARATIGPLAIGATSIANAGGGNLDLALFFSIVSMPNTGATQTYVASGTRAVLSVAQSFNTMYLASSDCFGNEGSVWSVNAGAAVHRVTTKVCALALGTDPAGNLYSVGADGTVSRVSQVDGSLSILATTASGIVAGTRALAADAQHVYAGATMSSVTGQSIARITGSTVDRNFILMPNGLFPLTIAVTGTDVWILANDKALYRTPITGGAAVLAAPFIAVSGLASLTPDGAGGVLLSDGPVVTDVDAAAHIKAVASGTGCVRGISREPSGNMFCGTNDPASPVRVIFP